MTTEFLLIIILLLLSGFFSGSELAYVVANKIKVEVKARKKNPATRSALHFINNPQEFFSVILIGNNIVNIALASVCAVIFAAFFGWNEFTILIVSTLILLFFGELVPKYIASELGDRVILLTALPLRIFTYVIYPFVKITASLSELLTSSTNLTSESISYLFSKEDIETLIKESHEAGIVNKNESDIISKVIALGDQKVYEAMRPRTEIIGVEMGQSIDDVITAFIESGFSKLPVYEEDLDNIKGVVYAYDIFKMPKDLQSIIKEVSFVPETKKSIDMLNEFLEKRISIAIVIDEFGGTAGLVTTEDIIEELFGEIKDEYDTEEDICRRISPNTYLVSAKVEIDHINEKYQLVLPYGDYETMGGYITSKLGRIPAQGETVTIDNFNILIARANSIKIELVKLTVKQDSY